MLVFISGSEVTTKVVRNVSKRASPNFASNTAANLLTSISPQMINIAIDFLMISGEIGVSSIKDIINPPTI